MMCVMMWARVTVAATTPATQTKRMAGMRVERGEGLLAEDTVVEAAAAGTATVVAAAYCRGCKECNIPVQKMGAKEWKRSHKSKKVLCYIS